MSAKDVDALEFKSHFVDTHMTRAHGPVRTVHVYRPQVLNFCCLYILVAEFFDSFIFDRFAFSMFTRTFEASAVVLCFRIPQKTVQVDLKLPV